MNLGRFAENGGLLTAQCVDFPPPPPRGCRKYEDMQKQLKAEEEQKAKAQLELRRQERLRMDELMRNPKQEPPPPRKPILKKGAKRGPSTPSTPATPTSGDGGAKHDDVQRQRAAWRDGLKAHIEKQRAENKQLQQVRCPCNAGRCLLLLLSTGCIHCFRVGSFVVTRVSAGRCIHAAQCPAFEHPLLNIACCCTCIAFVPVALCSARRFIGSSQLLLIMLAGLHICCMILIGESCFKAKCWGSEAV